MFEPPAHHEQEALSRAVREIQRQHPSLDAIALSQALVEELDTPEPLEIRRGDHVLLLQGNTRQGTPLVIVLANGTLDAREQARLQALYYRSIDPTALSVAIGDQAWPGIDYLFGGHWWGRLEAELYAAFADPSLDPDNVTPFIQRAHAILSRTLGDEPTPVRLDVLLDELPDFDSDGPTYVPIGTLIATGLLLGEEVRRQYPEFEWVPGAQALTRYFALRKADGAVLRPIDFAIQRYKIPLRGGLRDYLGLAKGQR